MAEKPTTEEKTAKKEKATEVKADNLFTLGLLARTVPHEEWQAYFSLWRFGGSLKAQERLRQILVYRLENP